MGFTENMHWTFQCPQDDHYEIDIHGLKNHVFSVRVFANHYRSIFSRFFVPAKESVIFYDLEHILVGLVQWQQHHKFRTKRMDLVVDKLHQHGYVLVKTTSPVSRCCVASPIAGNCNHCGTPYCEPCFRRVDPCGARIFFDDIEQSTLKNDKPMDLVFKESGDAPRLQVGYQSVLWDIPWETHRYVTQFFRVEKGEGKLEIQMPGTPTVETYMLHDGSAAIIPTGYPHHIVNMGPEPLKLYSIYAKNSDFPDWIH